MLPIWFIPQKPVMRGVLVAVVDQSARSPMVWAVVRVCGPRSVEHSIRMPAVGRVRRLPTLASGPRCAVVGK